MPEQSSEQSSEQLSEQSSEQSRLAWQCRRGMRELDLLLLQYLESRYARANDDEKSAFQAVLDLPDPELNGYLLQRQTPVSEPIARVIECILSLPHT